MVDFDWLLLCHPSQNWRLFGLDCVCDWLLWLALNSAFSVWLDPEPWKSTLHFRTAVVHDWYDETVWRWRCRNGITKNDKNLLFQRPQWYCYSNFLNRNSSQNCTDLSCPVTSNTCSVWFFSILVAAALVLHPTPTWMSGYLKVDGFPEDINNTFVSFACYADVFHWSLHQFSYWIPSTIIFWMRKMIHLIATISSFCPQS